jgi:hypothetical protein
MPGEPLFLPTWIAFLVGVVLYCLRKWVADVGASIASLEERLRALEKSLADCRLDLARDHPTRPELDRLEERLETQATRLTILEERCLDA